MAGKGGILALLASPKKGSSKGPPMGDMGGDPAGGGGDGPAALREVFDLLKAGDDDGAWTAFKRASAACGDDYEHDEPDADELGGPSDGDMDNEE